MIFHDIKCCFIHIPRTAGTSIEHALLSQIDPNYKKKSKKDMVSLYSQKHFFPSEIESLIPKNYYSFSIVRNPYDRILSYYRWRTSPNTTWVPDKEKRLTFLDWLVYSFDNNGVDRDNKIALLNQADSIASSNKLTVDYVGRFEELSLSFNKICDDLGLNLDLPMINKTSDSKSYRDIYTDITVDLVTKAYQKDIDYFGYSF